MINSYPNVYSLGHAAIEDIFSSEVIVEEKIDGSQFSMGVFDNELYCRSKNKEINLANPESLFDKAVEIADKLASKLHPNWIYRCEYLKIPKHNVLTYSRVPKDHLIVFDIMIGGEKYLPYWEKVAESKRIGLECVPLLYEGLVKDVKELFSFLDLESILGGTKIEGVVVKNYQYFTRDKKIMVGKLVSEKFKEVNQFEFKQNNPTGKDFLVFLAEKYHTEARWNKAIQHLSENGELENSPKDIGKLLKEIPNDILKEEKDAIQKELFKYFYPIFKRIVTRGFPEYYKEYLVKRLFK